MNPYKPLRGELPRRCSCCPRTLNGWDWAALKSIGVKEVPPDPTDREKPEGYFLEMRNCSCGTTICVEVERRAP